MYIQTFRNGTGPINVKPPVGRNLANRNHDIAVYFHKYILQQMVRHFSFTYFLPRPCVQHPDGKFCEKFL